MLTLQSVLFMPRRYTSPNIRSIDFYLDQSSVVHHNLKSPLACLIVLKNNINIMDTGYSIRC